MSSQKFRFLFKSFTKNFLVIFILLTFILFIWIVSLVKELPDYNNLLKYNPHKITRIYTSDLCLIEEYGKEKRVYKNIADIPTQVINAFIAAEDKNFFTHKGIDIFGITRSSFKVVSSVLKGKRISGASTITQQLVKNLLLDNKKSIKRKVKEILLSYVITKKFTKHKILELYLNQIYFGSGVYGICEAARYYFNKKLEDLDVSEIAFLAGILPSPGAYAKEKNHHLAKIRRDYVILRMEKDNYITQEQASVAYSQKLVLKKYIKRSNTVYAPNVADRVCEIVMNKYGEKYFYTEGLTIVTSIDSFYQKQANLSLDQGIKNYNENIRENIKIDEATNERADEQLNKKNIIANKTANGSIIALNHRTGQILAMSGGVTKDSFDRATQAKRQIGSLAKIFVYLAALENNIALNTIFVDEDIAIDQGDISLLWEPQNYEKNFLGPMTMRYAFEKSRNVVTVKIGMQVGLKKVLETMQKCGIQLPKSKAFLSVFLGAVEITLQDMVNACAIIANGGKKVESSLIEYIQNSKGEFIYKRVNEIVDAEYNVIPIKNFNAQNDNVIDPSSAFQMIHLLQGAAQRGTAKKFTRNLKIGMGGKTGTTSNNCDTWFLGFDSNIIVGSYVGFDIPISLGKRAVGATVALPIVESFFKAIVQNNMYNTNIYFPVADNIYFKRINLITGEETKENDSILESFKINAITNK